MAELQSDSPYELEKMTELYRPPEGYLRKYLLGTSSDMWSVGVIIIELVTGDVVFANAQGWLRAEDLAWAYGCKGSLSRLSRMLIQKNSPSPELTGDIMVHFSSALLSLTQDLLRCNPKARLTAQAALEHKYFEDGLPPVPLDVFSFFGIQ
ncbi:cyclin-dependent kinase 14-like [Oratosquilla oratoria]|uniref:cyclin-dependent kinase 14-like n=1 Tax=Oratosquilla oratoria TaxID=337810 RepID=UPI003F76D722